jgi:hypothetical protein
MREIESLEIPLIYSSLTEVTNNPENQNPDVNTTLNNFLAEFKGLFTQLLNQNNMVLSMLTTLINKTH